MGALSISVSQTTLKNVPGLGFEELPEGIAAAFGGTIRGQGSHHGPTNKLQIPQSGKFQFVPGLGFEPR